jgi:cold shock protein
VRKAEPSNKQQGGSVVATGTVKWFSNEKGYGFISREGGSDLFVHYSAIEGGGYKSLEEGESVEFEVTQGPKGDQATSVRRI